MGPTPRRGLAGVIMGILSGAGSAIQGMNAGADRRQQDADRQRQQQFQDAQLGMQRTRLGMEQDDVIRQRQDHADALRQQGEDRDTAARRFQVQQNNQTFGDYEHPEALHPWNANILAGKPNDYGTAPATPGRLAGVQPDFLLKGLNFGHPEPGPGAAPAIPPTPEHPLSFAELMKGLGRNPAQLHADQFNQQADRHLNDAIKIHDLDNGARAKLAAQKSANDLEMKRLGDLARAGDVRAAARFRLMGQALAQNVDPDKVGAYVDSQLPAQDGDASAPAAPSTPAPVNGGALPPWLSQLMQGGGLGPLGQIATFPAPAPTAPPSGGFFPNGTRAAAGVANTNNQMQNRDALTGIRQQGADTAGKRVDIYGKSVDNTAQHRGVMEGIQRDRLTETKRIDDARIGHLNRASTAVLQSAKVPPQVKEEMKTIRDRWKVEVAKQRALEHGLLFTTAGSPEEKALGDKVKAQADEVKKYSDQIDAKAQQFAPQGLPAAPASGNPQLDAWTQKMRAMGATPAEIAGMLKSTNGRPYK